MPEPQYNIRQAGLDDLELLISLENQILGMWTRQMIVADLSDTRKEIYILFNDKDEAMGYIDVWYGYENDCHILSFGMRERYRRQGLGSILINHIIETARIRNLTFISLEVKTDNLSAIQLYKKFNFEELGYRKKYYKDGSDALIMMLEL